MVTTFTLAHSPLIEGVFWVTVAFIIFFILFGKRLWVPMAKMLDARAAQVRSELAEASRLREEAEAMLKDAEARRHAALEDAKRLLEGAATAARQLAAAAAAEAEEAARRREQMAADRIAAAQKAALASVRIAAIDVATQAATEIIHRELDPAGDAALIDRAIAGLPAALARKVA